MQLAAIASAPGPGGERPAGGGVFEADGAEADAGGLDRRLGRRGAGLGGDGGELGVQGLGIGGGRVDGAQRGGALANGGDGGGDDGGGGDRGADLHERVHGVLLQAGWSVTRSITLRMKPAPFQLGSIGCATCLVLVQRTRAVSVPEGGAASSAFHCRKL